MKRHVVIFVFFLFASNAFTQVVTESVYLFPEFEKGVVVMNKGAKISALLNYNTVNEEIVFETPDKTIQALANSHEVAFIQIGERLFEYATKNIFYERVKLDNGNYYIQWKKELISKGKSVGYGGYTAASSGDNVTELSFKTTHSRLDVNEKFEMKVRNAYYLKIDGDFKRFNNYKKLADLFNIDKVTIENFVKLENLNFNNINDITKVVSYCYSLSK